MSHWQRQYRAYIAGLKNATEPVKGKISISLPSPDRKKAAKPDPDPRMKQNMGMLAEMGQAEVNAMKRNGTTKTRTVTRGRPVVAWVDTTQSCSRSKPYETN